MRNLNGVFAALLCGVMTSAGALAGDGSPVFVERSTELGAAASHEPTFAFMTSQVPLAPMTSGGSVGDFDNDGDQDLLVIGGGAEPDRLFINYANDPEAPVAFVDEAAERGLLVNHMGIAAAVGDYNNDGWLDIFMTSLGPAGDLVSIGDHLLYRNNGDGTFTDVAAAAGVDTTATIFGDGMGAAWGDYDLDGDLDLYVTGWTMGIANRLFRNNGDETFTDVTESAGVEDGFIRGFSPRFADLDGDRYPELIVAADFGTSRYFVNNRDGTFTNMTIPAGVGLDGNGMGHVLGDFNHDGRFDWYVTSIHSEAPIPPNVPGTGNMLYLNADTHEYYEQSIPYLCNDGGWGWGVVAVDINLDSFEDMIETNGWVQHAQFTNEQCFVYLHDGVGGFDEIGALCGVTHDLMGRGLLNFDYDLDGDQDVVVFTNQGPLHFYENMSPLENGWLRVLLDTDENPRLAPNGYGAVVRATFEAGVGPVTRHRIVSGGMTYVAQSELSAHFGLGGARVVTGLRVEWPDGTVTTLNDIAPNQTITVSSGYRSDLTGDDHVDASDLAMLLARFGSANAAADLNADGVVDAADIAVLIENWNS